MAFGSHSDEASSWVIDNQLRRIGKLCFRASKEQHCFDRWKIRSKGSRRAGNREMLHNAQGRAMRRRYKAYLASARPVSAGERDRTYGLLVFSQVVRSISTVHSALNLRSCRQHALGSP